MALKIKNYDWNGFGFPVIFSELPAEKLRGELVPDVDFNIFSKSIIEIMCTKQDLPLSGNQVKFIRHYLKMTLREFAKFMDVTHQSVMRWEKNNKSPAKIDRNTELVLRIKVLKALKSTKKSLDEVVDKISEPAKPTPISGYIQKLKPILISQEMVRSAI